ncbi:hypothetical protein ACJMK2_033661 [Sinanodonta woodiana]|uniref:Ectonucleotide pyrophosphatase/phosphodiesterase family member 5 n=1 Tax=Sinanodonta woodiana TaxID=1069815 RepID=A0ABD3WT90_SINWO
MMTRADISSVMLLILAIVCVGPRGVTSSMYARKVLLISMDGFRWDYIEQHHTPNFDAFAAEGVRARYINNTFITKTFPCHYSIVIGLYEESHGIIANRMYDPVFNETFTMATKTSKWWDGGEPVWVTARKHGKKSATYYWPGSETEIHGFRPNIWKHYNESDPFNIRIDTVIQWLLDDQADIVTLYFHEPDYTGHKFGPNSTEVSEKIKEMDGWLGYLMKNLTDHGLWDSVNVIVTSDHGMTAIDVNSRVIDIYDYVDPSTIQLIATFGEIMSILPVNGKEDEMVRNLTSKPHMTVYKKKDIPEHWHYKNNRRIMPILLVAEEGWLIVKNRTAYPPVNVRGSHGYDNRLSSMKPIFYARGPDFKRNYLARPFNSIDLYPLMCKLLGIDPAPNNGTLDNTADILVSSITSSAMSNTWFVANVMHEVTYIFTCMFENMFSFFKEILSEHTG